MTEIDYEALANAMSRAALDAIGREPTLDGVNQSAARAVVAALRDQGFVVVRAEASAVLNAVGEWRADNYYSGNMEDVTDAIDAYAALAAPGDGDAT